MDLLARRAAEEEAARAAAQAAAAQASLAQAAAAQASLAHAAAQAAIAVACSSPALPAVPPRRRSRAPLVLALGLAFLAALGMGVAAERLLGAHGRGSAEARVSAD